jgi:hypothetical protein
MQRFSDLFPANFASGGFRWENSGRGARKAQEARASSRCAQTGWSGICSRTVSPSVKVPSRST